MHARVGPDSLDDALHLVAPEWSGKVLKPKPGEQWSTVIVTERTAAALAPQLSQLFEVATVAGDAENDKDLPRPVVTGFEPIFDTEQVLALTPKAIERFRRRDRARRLLAPLGMVALVAFFAVDYFWFLNPSRWLIPALAVFVLDGIALIVLQQWLRRPPRALRDDHAQGERR